MGTSKPLNSTLTLHCMCTYLVGRLNDLFTSSNFSRTTCIDASTTCSTSSNFKISQKPTRSPQIIVRLTPKSSKTSLTFSSTISVTITGIEKYEAIGVARTPRL